MTHQRVRKSYDERVLLRRRFHPLVTIGAKHVIGQQIEQTEQLDETHDDDERRHEECEQIDVEHVETRAVGDRLPRHDGQQPFDRCQERENRSVQRVGV